MKKKSFIILGVCISLILVYIVMFMIQINNSLKWDVNIEITAEQRDRYSNIALMPAIADIFERTGKRGWRDTEYMVESHLYGSYDELCDAMPDGCREAFDYSIKNDLVDEGLVRDLNGDPVKAYSLEPGYLPLIDEKDADSKYSVYSYWRYFYLLEYPDGTWRFATDLQNT